MEFEVLNKAKRSEIKFAEKNEEYFNIKIKLINQSNKRLFYEMINCYWFYNFVTNNDNVRIYPEFCDKNTVQRMVLDPAQKRCFNTVIGIRGVRFNEKNILIKLGFILVNPITNSSESVKYDKFKNEIKQRALSKNNIIWSSPVLLKIER